MQGKSPCLLMQGSGSGCQWCACILVPAGLLVSSVLNHVSHAGLHVDRESEVRRQIKCSHGSAVQAMLGCGAAFGAVSVLKGRDLSGKMDLHQEPCSPARISQS